MPTKDGSRIFTIFVIIIGVFGITGYMADFFGSLIKKMIDNAVKWWYQYDRDDDAIDAPTRWQEKIGFVVLILIFLLVVATVFLMIEHKLDFVTSIYWAIVSMTRSVIYISSKSYELPHCFVHVLYYVLI